MKFLLVLLLSVFILSNALKFDDLKEQGKYELLRTIMEKSHNGQLTKLELKRMCSLLGDFAPV